MTKIPLRCALVQGALCLAAMGGLMISPSTANPDSPGKVTIFHIPPGNPENAHTITVGIAALPAHLAHGDSMGECDGGGGDPGLAEQ